MVPPRAPSFEQRIEFGAPGLLAGEAGLRARPTLAMSTDFLDRLVLPCDVDLFATIFCYL